MFCFIERVKYQMETKGIPIATMSFMDMKLSKFVNSFFSVQNEGLETIGKLGEKNSAVYPEVNIDVNECFFTFISDDETSFNRLIKFFELDESLVIFQ